MFIITKFLTESKPGAHTSKGRRCTAGKGSEIGCTQSVAAGGGKSSDKMPTLAIFAD